MKKIIIILTVFISLPLFGKAEQEIKKKNVAVFIPGVLAGSPIYEDLDAGVREATKGLDIGVKTIEGGFEAGEWLEKIKSIAATGLYDLIVSSNPSIPQIMDEVSKDFPDQRFLCLDGKWEGNPNIYTAEFTQFDQAYMAGYMAGLVTLSSMKGANPDKKIGMIIAHHYPVLDNIIIPGVVQGVRDVDKDISILFKVVGNWWDATKASELTTVLAKDGVDVFLPIAGGATQGVISKAQDLGKYVIHFDSNGYNKAPGTVIGSTILRQKELTKKLVTDYLNNKLDFGNAESFSAKDGYIDFIQDDPLYQKYVPANIRDEIEKIVRKIKK